MRYKLDTSTFDHSDATILMTMPGVGEFIPQGVQFPLCMMAKFSTVKEFRKAQREGEIPFPPRSWMHGPSCDTCLVLRDLCLENGVRRTTAVSQLYSRYRGHLPPRHKRSLNPLYSAWNWESFVAKVPKHILSKLKGISCQSITHGGGS